MNQSGLERTLSSSTWVPDITIINRNVIRGFVFQNRKNIMILLKSNPRKAPLEHDTEPRSLDISFSPLIEPVCAAPFPVL
jgi:hypothetical protein